ncbi:hypothetical protein KKB83_02170 [Patescibacteria group bacterium]|nr:hypothetical protein [Patescibacteria group bacterium]
MHRADQKLQVPYCQECYDKINRHLNWASGPPVEISGWPALIVAILYLINRIHEDGTVTLLNKNTWGEFVIIFFLVVGTIWVILIPINIILEPLLLKFLPSKFARSAVEANTALREKTVSPTPGSQIKVTEGVLEEIEFANAEYAKKFREANNLG